VPLVGDLAVTVFKPNSRNAALLEEFLIARVALEQQLGLSASASTSATANGSINASAAQAALSAPIDVNSKHMVAGDTRGAVQPAKGKKSWYGWGS